MKSASRKNNSGPVNPFNPEELEEVQGPTYAADRPGRRLQDSIKETEEATGLDFDSFDDFRVEDLPEDSLAQTQRREYTGSDGGYVLTVLAADPELLDLGSDLRNHALTHENVHGRHFTGRLYDTLVDQGLDGEEAGRLHSVMEKDESRLEGATEIITHFLDPNSERVGRSFYPDEMAAVEAELEGDSELVDEIEEVKHEVVDQYREVYEVEASEGLYHERGSFAGQDYDALVLGDSAEVYGDEIVGEYLVEDSYPDNEYQEFVESNGYGGDVLENTVVEDYLG
ncbi:MAG: hypothetical protein ABEK10_04950 [Candidatus Nanosalina sp.]